MSEGDAHGGHSTSLRDYLRVVRRRKWIILQAVILVPAVAVGLSLRQEKVYKATPRCAGSAEPRGPVQRDQPGGCQPADRRAQTQADLARVPPVAQRTLELAGVGNTGDEFLAIERCAKTNSDLLELSAWDHDPRLRKTLAAAYARAFAGSGRSSTPART